MAPNCPYQCPYKVRHYMMGYNDHLDGNERRYDFDDPKKLRAYNKGWKHAGIEV